MITIDLERLPLFPGARVLDIGCGTGRHACAIHATRQGIVVAADIKITDLVETRRRLRFHDQTGCHRGGRWAVSAADITRLPFSDESFDLVICSEVLEHIPDDRKALTELARVLKTGRPIVVSVPRFYVEKICWHLSDAYHREPGGHIRIYSRKRLIRRLESAGFAPGRHHYAHSLHAPYWWLKCLVGVDRTDVAIVNGYHRFLTWEIMKKPMLVCAAGYLLNPVLGKSLVVYAVRRGW